MKSLKLLLSVLLIGFTLILLISCEDRESTVIVYDKLDLQGTAVTHDSHMNLNDLPLEYSDLSYLNATGTSNVNGLLKNTLSMSHIAFLDEYNNIRLEEGEFRISGPKGDYFLGTYNGGARDQDSGKWASLSISITQGGGIYQDASGNLTAEVVPDLKDGDQFTIHYRGVIRKPRVLPSVD